MKAKFTIAWRKTLKSITILVLTAVLFSCKKAEIGPAGPAGPQGNANVQTTIQAIQPADWSAIVPNYQYAKTVNVASISQNIIDKGTVELYISTDGLSWGSLNGGFSYSYSLGQVMILDNLNNS